MATVTVLKFMQKTAEDEALRHQLEALLGVGDGNISSEAELDLAETEALKGERAPVVADFAAQHGFMFSTSDLIAVVDAFQKHQSGELSDDDFALLIGTTPVDEGTGNQALSVANPLKRLSKYLTRTYFGY
jgi:hypothetical protein